MNWKEFLVKRKPELYLTFLILAVILYIFPIFLSYNEQRQGAVLTDPILIFFNPVDLTWFTFGLIYISIITAILSFSLKPEKLIIALQSYSLLVVFRMIVMYVTPLNEPGRIIILNDPFVQLFGTGETLTKDLFFSGHTATLFLLFLVADKKYLKYIFMVCTLLVGTAVLLQHVHYTVDVLVAPFFAYTSYRIAINIKEKITNNYLTAVNK
jgi:membrane-associated phospholipid phosphatase